MVRTAALILAAFAPQKPTPPPLVQTVESPPVVFQDWSVEPYDGFADSWTVNESQSTLGVACGKYCVLYLRNGARCSKGDSYPMLVSLPGGVKALDFKCYLIGKSYYVGTPFTEEWIDWTMKGGRIGLASAMTDGTFAVSRFSLNGLVSAIAKMGDWLKAQEDDGQAAQDFTI